MINYKSILIIVSFLLVNPFISSAKSESNDIKQINILMPSPFADSTKELVKQFNTENSHKIKIKVIRGPRETESVSDLAISSLLLGNSPYNIVLIDVTWLPKYAAAGWLSSLDNYISDKEWSSLAAGSRLGNEFNSIKYRFPMVSDMGLLYWRNDLMDSPPKTPAELLSKSLDLKNKGLVEYGYVWQGKQYEGLSCVFLEILSGFGGKWLNGTKVHLDSNESIKAAEWLSNMIVKGASPISVTNFTENEALQAFASGKAAFMRNWPYAWSELQKENSPVKGKVSITTMVSQKGIKPVSTLGSWGLSIIKGSQNQKESYEVIKHLTSPKSQEYLFTKFGYTPTHLEVLNSNQLRKKYPILITLSKALSYAKPRPQTPLYAQISNVLQTELSSLITGVKTASKAMHNAQVKTYSIIRSAGRIR